MEKINNMNVLITGGAGFIGSTFIKKLHKYPTFEKAGNFISLDNYSTGTKDNHLRDDKNKKMTGIEEKYVSGDIGNPHRDPDEYRELAGGWVHSRRTGAIFDNLIDCNLTQGDEKEYGTHQRLGNPDLIVHFADVPRITDTTKPFTEYQNKDYPSDLIDTNVVGTKNILEFARHGQQPEDREKRKSWGWKNIDYSQVFYIGSTPDKTFYQNDHTFTKWQGEELCKFYYKTFGMNIGIFKFGKVFGDEHKIQKDNNFYIGGKASVYDVGSGVYNDKDRIHVDDVCMQLLSMIGKDLGGKTYHLSANLDWMDEYL